jgi:hypothetical protein
VLKTISTQRRYQSLLNQNQYGLLNLCIEKFPPTIQLGASAKVGGYQLLSQYEVLGRGSNCFLITHKEQPKS